MRNRAVKLLKWALLAIGALLLFLGAEAAYILTAPLAPSWVTVTPGRQDAIDFEHYPYSATVNAYMEGLCAKYPDLIKATRIGRSVEGKPIFGYTVTNFLDGDPDRKPGFMTVAQLHAREPIGSQTALYFVTYLVENYGRDQAVTALLDAKVAYVVPQANPDGNDIFLTSDEALRGNARPTDRDRDGRFNEDTLEAGLNHYQRWLYAFGPRFFGYVDSQNRNMPQRDKDGDGMAAEDPVHGVDLNRNFGSSWSKGNPDPWSETYRGPEPFSEPETRAIRDFALAHPNVVSYLDLHSGSNSYLYPPTTQGGKPPEADRYDEIGRKLSTMLNIEGLPFTYSQNPDPVGKSADWFYSRGVFAQTLEVFGSSRTDVVRRLWPTPFYVRYTSLSRAFNPPPGKLEPVLENRLEGVMFIFTSAK